VRSAAAAAHSASISTPVLQRARAVLSTTTAEARVSKPISTPT